MSLYLYRRGKGADRRVVHLAMFNSHGEVVGPWCQRRVNLNTSCNLPLGLRVCKLCLKAKGAAT